MTTIKYTPISPENPSYQDWTFKFPTVTVTKMSVRSAFGFARMSTKYVYTVRSILIADSAQDLADKKAAAEDVLLAVGGTFEWVRDAATVIKWGPTDDVNFGPHPTILTFDKFYGVHTVIMTWQIEIETAAVDNEVLDVVYTTTHSLDKNFYTTRTTSGMLRLNGAKFNHTNFEGSDAYRNTVEEYVCSTPSGWQRVSQNYQMSADGLTLTFSVTDQQQFAVLPENCTDGDASLSVEGNPRRGPKKDFKLTGWFESPTDTPRAAREAFVSLATALFNVTIDTSAFKVKYLGMEQSVFKPRFSFTMIWDAWEPEDLDEESSSTPGGTETERRANWMLSLLTRSETWLTTYKGGTATDRGAYGTTDVLGWCGSGLKAPALAGTSNTAIRKKIGGGNSSTSGENSNDFVEPENEKYYYEYAQKFSYSTDYGLVVIPYKGMHSPRVQQVHAPKIFLTVRGRIVQNGKPPELPEPPYLNTEAFLLKADTSFDEVKIGQEHTLEWRYLMLIKIPAAADALDNRLKFLKIPGSPFAKFVSEDQSLIIDDDKHLKYTNYLFENNTASQVDPEGE